MLSKLYIKNYILISELEIDFISGFSTITGETGAGKSILLGAVSLITGNRADTNVLLDKEKKCVVEGYFDISDFNLETLFDDLDIDYDSNTIIRREINPKGKTRAFVNDSPVSVSTLKQLGEKLIDIHSQHNNIFLNNSNFYRNVVDSFAGLNDKLNSYTIKYNRYKNKLSELSELEANIQKAKQELDYFQFRFNQINDANIIKDEEVELETELNKLNNAEEIKTSLDSVYHGLSSSDDNIIQSLESIKNILYNVNNLGIDAETYKTRIASIIIELKDISEDIDSINSSVEYDASKIESLNERLNLIFDLHHKFSVKTNAELLEIKEDMNEKLSGFAIDESKSTKLKGEIEKQEKELFEIAEKISIKRKSKKSAIEKYITSILVLLGIKNAIFSVEIDTKNVLTKYGIDEISFLFSANKNIEAREISKSASGGEVSRIMLALKSLLAKTNNLPTIIFDEIDTGVSGEIAAKMAEIMFDLSKSTQVLSITHLPQIAVKGNEQFIVYKDDTDKTSQTKITKLNKLDRVNEIAKMLSGKELTSAAIENAKALLN